MKHILKTFKYIFRTLFCKTVFKTDKEMIEYLGSIDIDEFYKPSDLDGVAQGE